MIIEIVIYTCFVVFLFIYCTSGARFLSLAGFMVSSTALEIMNLTVFQQQGTRYPESIFYFPGYRFPVAIIFFSAIYAGVISLISLKVINLLKPGFFRKSIFLTIVAVLNLASLFIEKLGMASGYWIHEKAKNISDIWYFIYLFYLIVILGGIFFLLEEAQRKSE